MGSETELVLYGVSMLLLFTYAGALGALEVLSLSSSDRTDEEDETEWRSRLLASPVASGMAMALARLLAAALVVFMSLRVCSVLFSSAGEAVPAIVVALSLFVPILTARASAQSRPERFLRLAGPLVVPTAAVLKPAVGFLGALLRRIHPNVVRALSLPVLPLKDKIELYGGSNGDGADEERRIMSSVLEFGETRVREAMVPRIDIVAVNVNMDKDEAIDAVIEAGHSRIPMYEDTIDRVVGVLYTKDLLRRMVDGAEFSLRELAREAFFIPESKMIDDLLAEFQARKQHLAIVVDEYGGTAGMITLEDVLEEIVGDIQDEFDSEEALVERVDDDTAVVNAKIRVDELNQALGLELPEEVADSLGGLLYHLFERVPTAGEVLEEPPLRFEVNSVEGQRIDKVRISGLAAAAQEAGDGTVAS